jgi:hypothetical protein
MIRVIVEAYPTDTDGTFGAVEHCYLQSFGELDLPALIRYLNPVPDTVEIAWPTEAGDQTAKMVPSRPLLPEEN